MITAKEAKRLYDESGAEVMEFLDTKVEPVVIRAAKSGFKQCFIHCGCHEVYRTADPSTDVEKLAIEELKKRGFSVRYSNNGERYVPRGLANDDGEGPLHVNYGMTIGW